MVFVEARQEKLRRSGRDWRLSASWSPIKTLLKQPDHYSTIVLTGLRGSLMWAPIMPRDMSLSNSRGNFSQSKSVCIWWCRTRHVKMIWIMNWLRSATFVFVAVINSVFVALSYAVKIYVFLPNLKNVINQRLGKQENINLNN